MSKNLDTSNFRIHTPLDLVSHEYFPNGDIYPLQIQITGFKLLFCILKERKRKLSLQKFYVAKQQLKDVLELEVQYRIHYIGKYSTVHKGWFCKFLFFYFSKFGFYWGSIFCYFFQKSLWNALESFYRSNCL